jgi:large subunit ribosomal protein L25
MKSVPLTVFPRSLAKRTGVKKLRVTNRIPAVAYGRQNPPQRLEVPVLDFEKAIHDAVSEFVLLELTVDGDPRPKRLAIIQEVQHHALSGKVLHVDFHEVAEDEKVTITVPVETVGEAIGTKNGGILEHVLFKLRVRALPKDLPDSIKVDVTALELGKSIHIGEIVPPANTEILGLKKVVVISVAAPITEAEEAAQTAAAAEATPTEPEMLKEKKEEGEEGAVAEKGGEKKPAEKGGEKKAEKGAAPEKGGEKKAEKKAEKKK